MSLHLSKVYLSRLGYTKCYIPRFRVLLSTTILPLICSGRAIFESADFFPVDRCQHSGFTLCLRLLLVYLLVVTAPFTDLFA
ncbi:hypothetical protein JB92DRAFT_827589 [Gautieria morchelliformis]|nr:hypothetical protein JB92DRAFT_827589 [Gautieria morchelliformis]